MKSRRSILVYDWFKYNSQVFAQAKAVSINSTRMSSDVLLVISPATRNTVKVVLHLRDFPQWNAQIDHLVYPHGACPAAK